MTDEMEKIETCRTAMKAAMEAIQDYCGTASTHEFSFPDWVYGLATSDKTVNERIRDVKNYAWTGDQAKEICERLYPESADLEDCINNEADIIARGIVLLIDAEGRAEAERKYAKEYLGAS